ncbi:MAG: GIY-YIG nuclease family protein [Alphaproteobacteria bacterium]|nr:GIY-YIG nuclease family protein [Alphaproteobacteria bacterium]
MLWIVYILECADGSLYTGITNNLEKRLKAHETGNGAKYTNGRGPFRVVYSEELKTRSLASKREIEIKSKTRDEKKEMIENGLF